jgi:hypothetical protein
MDRFIFDTDSCNFDSPENTETRDHFIKSIHFTGADNVTNTSIPNRFD